MSHHTSNRDITVTSYIYMYIFIYVSTHIHHTSKRDIAMTSYMYIHIFIYASIYTHHTSGRVIAMTRHRHDLLPHSNKSWRSFRWAFEWILYFHVAWMMHDCHKSMRGCHIYACHTNHPYKLLHLNHSGISTSYEWRIIVIRVCVSVKAISMRVIEITHTNSYDTHTVSYEWVITELRHAYISPSKNEYISVMVYVCVS